MSSTNCPTVHRPADAHDSPQLRRFAALAAELAVVLPVSFFERAGNVHFNCVAVIDADGTNLGFYRKSHIPDGPGYQEKFYFTPGDTGTGGPSIAAGQLLGTLGAVVYSVPCGTHAVLSILPIILSAS